MTSTQRPAADDKAADAEYITAVRGGDTSAFGPLYKRHRASAYHLARQLVASPAEAEDLVSDAFAKVFNTLLAGGGPDSAFRAYLLTTVRNSFYDAVRQGKKLTYTDNLEPLDSGEPFDDPAVQGLDNTLAAKAFASLPERWQTVLWHTEIEGESPSQVAPLLGLTANGASALAYRAREGLKQAFLQAHVADVADSPCKVTSDRLGAWSRGGLSKREQTQVDRHLEECDRCAAVAAEIADLGTGLRGVVAVLAIGTPTLTAAYLAGGSMAKIGALAWAGAAAPAAGFTKISALLSTAGSSLGVGAAVGGSAAATGVGAGASVAGSAAVAAGGSAAAGGSGSSAVAAAASAAAHGTRGLWGAVAGTAAVAAIATVVIVSANFGDPEPSSNDAAAAPSTTQSQSAPPPSTPTAPQPSAPSIPSYAPLPTEEPGLDAELDNLPSIPAVNPDLLGELPSIEALPDEEEEEEEPAEEIPSPVDPDPGPADPGPTDPDPDPDPGPVDPDPGPGGEDETPAPTPSAPVVGPSTAQTSLVDGVITSEAIEVAHQGDLPYEGIELHIPAFGEPTGSTAQTPTTCTVTATYGANETTWGPQVCGAEDATFDNLLTEDMPSGELSFTISITAGDDITITEPIEVPVDVQTTTDTEVYDATVTLVLSPVAEQPDPDGEDGALDDPDDPESPGSGDDSETGGGSDAGDDGSDAGQDDSDQDDSDTDDPGEGSPGGNRPPWWPWPLPWPLP